MNAMVVHFGFRISDFGFQSTIRNRQSTILLVLACLPVLAQAAQPTLLPVRLITVGDEMRLTVDGKLIAKHHSEGFAHPMKRWFSFLIPNTVWIDNVKIWKIR